MTNTSEKDLTPIFADDDAENTFDFTDKVRSLHEKFDLDQDGFLNFDELAALQKATEGNTLTGDMYVMACKALDCVPTKGISLDALRLTYAAEGSDVEKDFKKVFTKKKTEPVKPQEKADDDEIIYEAGADGFDISS